MNGERGLYLPNGTFRTEAEIKKRLSFPDKKPQEYTFEAVVDVITRARAVAEKFEIGQKEATWMPAGEAGKPIVVALITDEHFGSSGSNVQLMAEHLDIVEHTQNMFAVFNGDDVDNFNATGKWASGMMEDPLAPQVVSRALVKRMKVLDDLAKIGAWGFGNHNDFGFNAGQDWYDSFLGGFQCPILTTGGMVHIKWGTQTYDLAMTHKYWGTSKLNPTNACKRYMDFEFPNADIAFLGHTHQSEGLHFEKGGKDRIAVIGGTYKDHDVFAPKHGIGGRSGSPGWAVALWPEQRKMQLFKDIKVAQEWLNGKGRISP